MGHLTRAGDGAEVLLGVQRQAIRGDGAVEVDRELWHPCQRAVHQHEALLETARRLASEALRVLAVVRRSDATRGNAERAFAYLDQLVPLRAGETIPWKLV